MRAAKDKEIRLAVYPRVGHLFLRTVRYDTKYGEGIDYVAIVAQSGIDTSFLIPIYNLSWLTHHQVALGEGVELENNEIYRNEDYFVPLRLGRLQRVVLSIPEGTDLRPAPGKSIKIGLALILKTGSKLTSVPFSEVTLQWDRKRKSWQFTTRERRQILRNILETGIYYVPTQELDTLVHDSIVATL